MKILSFTDVASESLMDYGLIKRMTILDIKKERIRSETARATGFRS